MKAGQARRTEQVETPSTIFLRSSTCPVHPDMSARVHGLNDNPNEAGGWLWPALPTGGNNYKGVDDKQSGMKAGLVIVQQPVTRGQSH